MKRAYEIAVLSKGAFARTVRIYSPKKADRALIMHDGQNAFYDGDAAFGMSWRALDALKNLGIKNTAVIGIDSMASTRYDDYLPFAAEDGYKSSVAPQTGGRAEVYFSYLESVIIPYLDKRFGYKLYGMLGSSAGALATLGFAEKKKPRIKAYGLFSAPLFVSGDAYGKFFEHAIFPSDALYYVYSGGSEDIGEKQGKTPQLFVDDSLALVNGLRRGGARDIKLRLENTADHNEKAWREPFSEFIKLFAEL